jgi:hypothetical protein
MRGREAVLENCAVSRDDLEFERRQTSSGANATRGTAKRLI